MSPGRAPASEIAKHCGVDVKTVGNWRKQMGPSLEFPKIQERTVTRNGTTYTQNTANIGRREAKPLGNRMEQSLFKRQGNVRSAAILHGLCSGKGRHAVHSQIGAR